MSHPLHQYIAGQLDDLLNKRGIVVFYDPRREFEPFFDRELEESGTGANGLPRVFVKERLTFLARYEGSFFALRNAVEPVVDRDQPEALIVYLPGVDHDRRTSVLMELEKGGTTYEPQLRRLALNVLRQRFSDGQIDEMLRPAHVGYDEIASFLDQDQEATPPSLLRTIFEGAQSEALISRWLVEQDKDAAIEDKDAARELFKLIESRLGLSMPGSEGVGEAREKLLRYLLVSEFRSDLGCPPPESVAMVPIPPSKDYVERIRGVAESLRQGHGESYLSLADKVEADLGLAKAPIDAGCLGNIDTFRFEERALLGYAGELIVSRRYMEALDIVSGRSRSFWVDRDVLRRSQWEACRLMAELGREIENVRLVLGKASADPAKWVQAYSGENGWFRVDALQRRLETWVSKMDEEPEAEKALAIVRREYEELLKKMAYGFGKIFSEADWAVQGALLQTQIYPSVVQAMGGAVAYFLVDALRFEMGAELVRQIEGASDVTLRAAIAALPTITPVGMAALLPGASASFSVVEEKGKLASAIEGSALADLSDRLKFLRAKVPDAVELALGKLLDTPPAKLSKAIEGASLVVVRSQEIDFVGEMQGDFLARQVMDSIIGNLARAVKKLATAGMENFVITADHGHQFSIRKDDDMKTDNPGGATVGIHRRCWIGHGAATPPGAVRVSGAELGYHTDLDFVFPTGLGVFKAGGGLSFHHGGISLQELVIPVISLRMGLKKSKPPMRSGVELRGVPDSLTNRTFGVRIVAAGGLFAGEPVNLRAVLLSDNQMVGQAGMAIGGDFDRATGILRMGPNAEANVGMMLTNDECKVVRIALLDPATDAVLDQSDAIPVRLGI